MFDWDYYSILGVKPDATTAESKSAWKRLQKIVHPDRAVPGDEADRKSREETSKRVNNAWQVLGNERTRREYDAYRSRQRRTAPAPAQPRPRHRGAARAPGASTSTSTSKTCCAARGARSRPSRTGGRLTDRSASPTPGGRDGTPATSLPGARAQAPTPTRATSLPCGRAPAPRSRPTTGRVPENPAGAPRRNPSTNGCTSTSPRCCATHGAGDRRRRTAARLGAPAARSPPPPTRCGPANPSTARSRRDGNGHERRPTADGDRDAARDRNTRPQPHGRTSAPPVRGAGRPVGGHRSQPPGADRSAPPRT